MVRISDSLEPDAGAIVRAALPDLKIIYGYDERKGYGWLGSMRSRTADTVPRDYISGGTNFLYLPSYGTFKRRAGQTIQFDSFGSPVGLLPAKWNAKARWADEHSDDTITDGYPTIAALLTRETVATGLDDGRFSQFWLRDQVGNDQYTLGSEFSPGTYPDPGAIQSLRFVPLWYDSGEGGITRGADEFTRRFFFGGARRWMKVGNWTYFPSLLGTPSRWDGGRATFVESEPLTPEADVNAVVGSNWGLNKNDGTASIFTTMWESLATDDAYGLVRDNVSPVSAVAQIRTTEAINFANSYTVRLKVHRLFGLPTTGIISVRLNDTTNAVPSLTTLDCSTLTDTPTVYEFPIDGVPTVGFGGFHALEVKCVITTTTPFGYTYVGYAEIVAGAGVTESTANRLIPSGPLPPVHAGTLAKGNAVLGSAGDVFMVPDADDTDGGWLDQAAGTDLFSQIDDATDDDTTYITSDFNDAPSAVHLSAPGFVPTGATHTVTIYQRVVRISGFPPTNCTLATNLFEGGTPGSIPATGTERTLGNSEVYLPLTAYSTVSYTLTAAEVDSVTDWTALYLVFNTGGTTGSVRVSRAYMQITAMGDALAGGWRGKDRFFYSVAYRFEDGSVWMPCTPRFPNTRLASGYGLFTVDAANPDVAYDKVVWSNLPIPPHGVTKKLLLRTEKIDSTTDDNLQLSPAALRFVAEVDANVLTYDDYFAEDDAITPDLTRLVIRDDHMMPPRARYIFAGDLRICHSYGGTNPCAIILAPVGAASDYDRNAADGASSVYAADGTYFRIVLDTAGAGSIEFKKGAGTSVALLFTDHPTLQDLVDRINATSFADLSGQWRAQLCPGVSGQARCVDSLTPHSRAIASVVRNGTTTITKAAGGLGDVAVGTKVSGAGYTAGTYVVCIVSDTELTISATATAGTGTATFYVELGDVPSGGTNEGWQRGIANSLPSFIFFNKTFLDADTFDKSATWMTTASPGANKSAANCFSSKAANRHTPPLEAGICVGGAGVDNGFVVFFANKRGAIRNTRDSGSGVDEEYRLYILNEGSGCCAWNTVIAGNRCAFGLSPEGLMAVDLFKERLLTEDIWVHGRNARGDFDYEIPLCVAATAADTDGAYASARIMRNALWLSFRASGSHPNRQICYDFSGDPDQTGIASFLRKNGRPYGWSVPLVRSVTAMCEGRRSDGLHLYGWNDANAGSTGDGRVDEIEVGDTDNGTAIAGSVETPWERAGQEKKMSGQKAVLYHAAPTGSTGSLIYHRSYLDDMFTLTPGTSNTLVVIRDVKRLPINARVSSPAAFWSYTQATGAAREIRSLVFTMEVLPSLD